MAVCAVLRCQETSKGRFRTNEFPLMESAVCAQHLDQLQSGEPWDYNGTGHEIVMGADLPRRLLDFEVNSGSGPGFELTLEREGDDKPFSLWLTHEIAAQLAECLRTEVPEGDAS